MLDLPPELFSRIDAAARRQGVDASAYLADLLDRTIPIEADPPVLAAEKRIQLAKEVQGKYAHLPGGSEVFMRLKHEDTLREEARSDARKAG